MRWAMPRLVVSRVLAWRSWRRTSSASERFSANQPVRARAPITTADTTSATFVAMLPSLDHRHLRQENTHDRAEASRYRLPEASRQRDYLSVMERPTPFELVFSGLAPEQFPPIRDALDRGERRSPPIATPSC